MSSFKDDCSLILQEVARALDAVEERKVDTFADWLLEAQKVFVVGVGRVMLSLEAFAKRLNHLGIATWYVGETNEPAISDRDLLVVASGSGESLVPVAIARKATAFGPRIVHIGSNPESSLRDLVDLFIRIPAPTKLALPDEVPSRQLMSSLFEQSLYLLGDAIALGIVRRRKIDIDSLWRNHANLE
jgi:6-phospho-3-hexuloisomerase